MSESVEVKIVEVSTGEVVRTFDVSDKSVSMQEKTFDTILHKTDLNRFDVIMTTPEDKPCK